MTGLIISFLLYIMLLKRADENLKESKRLFSSELRFIFFLSFFMLCRSDGAEVEARIERISRSDCF